MKDEYKHKGQRRLLVKKLEAKGIKDRRVLNAIGKVPRHIFFETALEGHAYEDKAFPIGSDQTISQPYTVARQTELLDLSPGLKVLEIGTGSGYQCSVLCEMDVKVYSVEVIKELYVTAKALLEKLGYKPRFFLADGSKGLPKHAPFDRIIATAGAKSIPEALIDQLAIGGKMVIPVGDSRGQTMIRLIKSEGNKLQREQHGEFSFVPLVGT